MSASNFDPSLDLTLVYEGGDVDDPRDPGGATSRGVTQQVYDDDRKQRGLPVRAVRLMTTAEMKAIYRWRYWDLIKADRLPRGADYVLFDFAVNSGVARATKALQRLVGITEDGRFGDSDVAAALEFIAVCGIGAFTDGICTARMAFLRGLKTFPTFGNGWTRRVMGAIDGRQAGDTGVIDRAYAMAMNDELWAPRDVIVTPKTYSASARSA